MSVLKNILNKKNNVSLESSLPKIKYDKDNGTKCLEYIKQYFKRNTNSIYKFYEEDKEYIKSLFSLVSETKIKSTSHSGEINTTILSIPFEKLPNEIARVQSEFDPILWTAKWKTKNIDGGYQPTTKSQLQCLIPIAYRIENGKIQNKSVYEDYLFIYVDIFNDKIIPLYFSFDKQGIRIASKVTIEFDSKQQPKEIFPELDTYYGKSNTWKDYIKTYEKRTGFKVPQEFVKYILTSGKLAVPLFTEDDKPHQYINWGSYKIIGEYVDSQTFLDVAAYYIEEFDWNRSDLDLSTVTNEYLIIGTEQGPTANGTYLGINCNPKSKEYGKIYFLCVEDDEMQVYQTAKNFAEYIAREKIAIESLLPTISIEDEDSEPEESKDEETEETTSETTESDVPDTDEETSEEDTDTENTDETTDTEEFTTDDSLDTDTEEASEDEREEERRKREEILRERARAKREETSEPERRETQIDEPHDEKGDIKAYVYPLIGDMVEHLKLFSAKEVNRPLYHISMNPRIKLFTPQISKRTMTKEDRSLPRISTSTSLIGCMNGYQSVHHDIKDRKKLNFSGLYKIYELPFQYAIKPDRKLVPDVDHSDEYWLISWKKDTYGIVPNQAGEFFVAKTETVYGNDGTDTVYHLYLRVTGDYLYLDHKRRLEQGYYCIKVKGYHHQFPLDSKNQLAIEIIDDKLYRRISLLSIMNTKKNN